MTDSTKFAVDVAEALERPAIEANARSGRWHPDADANDDCEVLVAVRKWTVDRKTAFVVFLHDIYATRGKPEYYHVLDYQIGDYARAALAVVEKEKTDARD